MPTRQIKSLARPRVARFPTPNRQEDAVALKVMRKRDHGAKGIHQQIDSNQSWLKLWLTDRSEVGN